MITVYLREDVKPLPLSLNGRKKFTTDADNIGRDGILADSLNAFFPWSSIAFFEWRD